MADAPNTSTYNLVFPDTANLPNSRVLTSDSGILLQDSGPGNNYNITTQGNLRNLANFGITGFLTYNLTSSTFSGITLTSNPTINIANPTGVGGNPFFSVIPDSSTQRITTQTGGVDKATKSKLNFMSGSYISISIFDNVDQNSSDVTISAVGFPGGGTVTSITAEAPNLTGGTITSVGTIGLNTTLTDLVSVEIS